MPSRVGRITGPRAVMIALALGFPSVAAGVIARRRIAMAVLEKTQADIVALRAVAKLRTEFGDGPVELVLPGRTLVVVLDDRDASLILDNSPEQFTPANREKRAALRPFQPHGVLISTGSARTRRRIVNETALETPKTLHSATGAFAAVIDTEIRILLDDSRRAGHLDATAFTRTWWRIVRQITLGASAREDTALTDALWKLRANGNYSYLLPPRRRLREEFFNGLYDYAERAEPHTLLAALDASPGSAVVDPVGQIPHWLFAFDAAGIATARALALVATHPKHLDRARNEINGLDHTKPHPLPYLRSCILESLRLWPTTPAILRDSVTETTWGTHDHTVPAGSGFLIHTPAFHRDRHALDYADSFTPDVWLDGRAETQRGLLPFSSGPAGCPGRNIALFTASTVLGAVLAESPDLRLTSTPQLADPDRLPVTLNHYRLDFAVN